MNNLRQNTTLLVGSLEDIKALENQEEATVLVISDSHGAFTNLYYVVKEFGSKCDALVFCGDGISDLSTLISKAQIEESLKNVLPKVIAFAQGNNDADTYTIRNSDYQEGTDTPFYAPLKVPLVQSLGICGHNVYITHGHQNYLAGNPELMHTVAQNTESNIIFYGHTHYASNEFMGDSRLFLNPGSISRPRGGQPPLFATVGIKKGRRWYDATFFRLTATGITAFSL